MSVTWYWVSAGANGGGAIACVELSGDVDVALRLLNVKTVRVGSVRRRSVPVGAAYDDAVIGRWSSDRATVMLHGGRAVVSGFLAACDRTRMRMQTDVSEEFIEADGAVESLMLAALARAQSPWAVDLLLDQPRRWRERPIPARAEASPRDAFLQRLIEPALVVAVGPPNVGKSSLLNALAGRGVAVVADQPGTTRDHVGALIDLGGVVVRWVDTPGLEERAKNKKQKTGMDAEEQIQAEAQGLARDVAARADVLVVCRDGRTGGGGGGSLAVPPPTSGSVVDVGLRADLGEVENVDASVSVTRGTGLERLVEVVREAVVPRRFMEDGEPWVFWPSKQGCSTPAP